MISMTGNAFAPKVDYLKSLDNLLFAPALVQELIFQELSLNDLLAWREFARRVTGRIDLEILKNKYGNEPIDSYDLDNHNSRVDRFKIMLGVLNSNNIWKQIADKIDFTPINSSSEGVVRAETMACIGKLLSATTHIPKDQQSSTPVKYQDISFAIIRDLVPVTYSSIRKLRITQAYQNLLVLNVICAKANQDRLEINNPNFAALHLVLKSDSMTIMEARIAKYNEWIDNHADLLNRITDLEFLNGKLVCLPEVVCRLPNLQTLDLSYNRLVRLPQSFNRTNLPKLTKVYLSHNNLTVVPPQLYQMIPLSFIISPNPLKL